MEAGQPELFEEESQRWEIVLNFMEGKDMETKTQKKEQGQQGGRADWMALNEELKKAANKESLAWRFSALAVSLFALALAWGLTH